MNLRTRSIVFLVLALQIVGYSFADDGKDVKKSDEYPKEHAKKDKHDSWHDIEASTKVESDAQEASMKSGSDTMKSGEKENNQVNPCNGDHPPSWCS